MGILPILEGFCKVVELYLKGCATNGATLTSLKVEYENYLQKLYES